ncbi:hypothetical protein ACKWTF_000262 [Chironomus riparius]
MYGETKMMMLLGESYKDCSKGPIKFLDWSEIEFVYENDTTYFINGKLKVYNAINPPWKMHYFIEKYDRGKWFTSMVDREIPDFCKVITDKKAPWHFIVDHLKRPSCPYAKNGVETFNMELVESALPSYYTFTMTGKYRVTFISTFTGEDGQPYDECQRLGFEMMPM